MAKRRISYQFDEKSAFDKSLDFDFSKNIFVTPELKKFLDLKAVQHAVSPKMFLPGFLVATSNVMACLRYLLTIKWNLFHQIIAGFHGGLGCQAEHFHLDHCPKGHREDPNKQNFSLAPRNLSLSKRRARGKERTRVKGKMIMRSRMMRSWMRMRIPQPSHKETLNSTCSTRRPEWLIRLVLRL